MADPLVVVTAITAGAAIIQPWAIALWKNYVRRGIITPYVTGFLEIGFSEYGPTLAIDGTLRALHKDVFVKSIKVILTKHQDKSVHEFEWLAFRSHRMSLLGSSSESSFIEAASGFMVTPNEPKRVCIVFSDSQTRQRIQSYLASALNRFYEIRSSEKFKILDQRFLLDTEIVLELVKELEETYRKDSIQIDAYSEIGQIFYWEAGQYDVEIEVNAAKPDRTFSEKWAIELSDEQVKRLRLNIINMLQSPLYRDLGLNPPQPFFAYVAYGELK